MISRHKTLEVDQVTKRFNGVLALDKVTLNISTEEPIALAGGNGAGKSTLLGIISGAIEADSGYVKFGGVPLRRGDVRDARAHGISMVFQESSICEDATVLDNLFLGSEITSRFGFLRISRMRELAAQVIDRHKLPIPSLTAIAGQLSGGQKKAIAIGRALLSKPQLLLLDEPTSSLGVKEQDVVLQNLVAMGKAGIGVVLCTHAIHEISHVAKRVIILRRGKLVHDICISQVSQAELAVLIGT